MNSFGGSPLITNGKWDETKFDIEKLFELNPKLAILFFTGYELRRYESGINGKEHVSIGQNQNGHLTGRKQRDVSNIFQKLRIEKNKQEMAMKDLIEFQKFFNIPSYGHKGRPIIDKEFYVPGPHIKINWLKHFKELLPEGQFTDDDKLLHDDSILNTRFRYTSSLNKR